MTARAFSELYQSQSALFPLECKGGDYEKRIQAAFPIHPEIFEGLSPAGSMDCDRPSPKGCESPPPSAAARRVGGQGDPGDPRQYATPLGSTVLRKHMDDVPLWRGDHVAVRQLIDEFARYLYLPRVAGPEVLVKAMRDGVALLTWQSDTFGHAESRDDVAGRYRGLRAGQMVSLGADDAGLLVKTDGARIQLEDEAQAASKPIATNPEEYVRPFVRAR